MDLKTALSYFMLFAAAGGTSIQVPQATSPAPVVAPAPTIEAKSESVQVVRQSGPYRGFDTSRYPGDSVMQVWRDAGEYSWVGYYLPAPCHRDSSWAGRRVTLEGMGWGTAVIYVGQQTWGRSVRSTDALGDDESCRANLLGAARGRLDADDAIATTEAEGFAPGTLIFLDIEHMDGVPQAMRDYYQAWTERVLEDGRYRPGYYAHTQNAEAIYCDVAALFAMLGQTEQPAFWIAGGGDFARDKSPEDVGHEFAAAWQGVLDIVEEQGGVKLPIDVSVGAFPSPSSSAFVVE